LVDSVLARESAGGTVAWYLPDRLGTVHDLINNSGSIIDHIDFSAFGTMLDQSAPSEGDRMMGFAGMELDSVTGMNLAVYRVQNPGTGRWTSQDPLAFSGGDVNLYRYAQNAVTTCVDPFGDADVELRYNYLFGDVGGGVYHAFIVITDPETGQQWYFRGGPENESSPYGNVVCEVGVFKKGSIDYPDAPGRGGGPGITNGRPVVVGRGQHDNQPVDPVLRKLQRLARDFNRRKIRYSPLGWNSKTVAHAAMAAVCGISRPTPPVRAPGWRLPLPPAPQAR
jgi:RHS repeat-associated protein